MKYKYTLRFYCLALFLFTLLETIGSFGISKAIAKELSFFGIIPWGVIIESVVVGWSLFLGIKMDGYKLEEKAVIYCVLFAFFYYPCLILLEYGVDMIFCHANVSFVTYMKYRISNEMCWVNNRVVKRIPDILVNKISLKYWILFLARWAIAIFNIYGATVTELKSTPYCEKDKQYFYHQDIDHKHYIEERYKMLKSMEVPRGLGETLGIEYYYCLKCDDGFMKDKEKLYPLTKEEVDRLKVYFGKKGKEQITERRVSEAKITSFVMGMIALVWFLMFAFGCGHYFIPPIHLTEATVMSRTYVSDYRTRGKVGTFKKYDYLCEYQDKEKRDRIGTFRETTDEHDYKKGDKVSVVSHGNRKKVDLLDEIPTGIMLFGFFLFNMIFSLVEYIKYRKMKKHLKENKNF